VNYRVFHHVAIERALPVPALALLKPVEKLVGGVLPALLREFLLAAQGGSIDYVFHVPTGKKKTEAMVFGQIFALADLPKEIALQRDTRNAPAGVLPIARTGGDDTLFVELGKHRARVIAHLTGRPAWTGRKRGEGLVELASSFEAYLDGLHIDVDAVIDGLAGHAKTKDHVDATVEYLNIGLPAWTGDKRLAAAVASARKRVKA
jgi:hypothetical protein